MHDDILDVSADLGEWYFLLHTLGCEPAQREPQAAHRDRRRKEYAILVDEDGKVSKKLRKAVDFRVFKNAARFSEELEETQGCGRPKLVLQQRADQFLHFFYIPGLDLILRRVLDYKLRGQAAVFNFYAGRAQGAQSQKLHPCRHHLALPEVAVN